MEIHVAVKFICQALTFLKSDNIDALAALSTPTLGASHNRHTVVSERYRVCDLTYNTSKTINADVQVKPGCVL